MENAKPATEMLRSMLVSLRDTTYERVRELRRDQEQESEPGPADEMDAARSTADVETHAGLIGRAEEKLQFIDEALSRLDQGKYGQCMKCGEAIPFERLNALPFAAYCIDCQQQRNRAKHGWSAGAMIPPYDHQWTLPEEMEEAGEAQRVATSTREAQEDMDFPREPSGEGETGEAPKRRLGRPRKRATT